MGSSPTLSKGEVLTALSVTAGAMAIGFLIHKTLCSKSKCVKPKVNLDFQKDNPKVVHAFDIEDLADKDVYCRCWRSKKVCMKNGINEDMKLVGVSEEDAEDRSRWRQMIRCGDP